jgi:hypothetical protein
MGAHRWGTRTLLATALLGVRGSQAATHIAWASTRWQIEARDAHVERLEGRDALYLHNRTAWLRGILRDGTIQFDLYASAQLGFYGVAFRAVDRQNYEHFNLAVRQRQSGCDAVYARASRRHRLTASS